jgi:hypothetical protein
MSMSSRLCRRIVRFWQKLEESGLGDSRFQEVKGQFFICNFVRTHRRIEEAQTMKFFLVEVSARDMTSC